MTRRILDRPEYTALLASANESVFRLETLNEYCVPQEEESFRAFLKGEDYVPDDGDIEWREQLRQDRRAGKIHERVHVVDLPLSDYLRYEIETGYAFSGPAGEDIRMIARGIGHGYVELPKQDFWLLDDHALILMHYDEEGRVLCRELVEDEPEMVAEYRTYKANALKGSVPFDQFYARSG